MKKSLESLIFLNHNICYICKSKKDDKRQFFCVDCFESLDIRHGKSLEELKYIDEVYYSAIYNRFLRETIREFKFHGKNYLSKPLGELLLDTMSKNEISHIDLIIPVPMTRRKQAKRGYNQSELLGRYISEKLEIEMKLKTLIKRKNTKAQSSLDSKARKNNLKGVFSVKNEKVLRDKKILLIDDIITTGSTLEECGKVLLKSGVREIVGLTLGSS